MASAVVWSLHAEWRRAWDTLHDGRLHIGLQLAAFVIHWSIDDIAQYFTEQVQTAFTKRGSRIGLEASGPRDGDGDVILDFRVLLPD